MNLDKLMEYDFAKKYVDGTLTEDGFLAELIKRIKIDQSFRENTEIISLEATELKKVVDALKAKRFHKSRRSFLIKMGIGLGILAADSVGYYLSSKSIDPLKLFNQISIIPELKPLRKPIFSKNFNAPIIIIIEDIHMGERAPKKGEKDQRWTIEFRQLEILRKKFGFNFVGIEGWAGHEVDKQRGRQILNAEDLLIKELIKNRNYDVVGLEHPNLQIDTLELEIFGRYKQIRGLQNKVIQILEGHGENKSEINKIFDYMIEQTSRYHETGYDTIMHEMIKNYRRLLASLPSNRGYIDPEIGFAFSNFGMFVNHIINGLIELYDIKKFSRKIFEERETYLKEKYSSFYQRSWELKWEETPELRNMDELRERFAVKKMIYVMTSWRD